MQENRHRYDKGGKLTASAKKNGNADLLPYGGLFRKLKNEYGQRVDKPDGLICKQGYYMGSHVLKLQKASWTNDPMDRAQNETGVFFSIWISQKSAEQRRVYYNIHALKMRRLKGYAITSRKFAEDFRGMFASRRHHWPNVRVDYGSLTLMEGWIELNDETLEDQLLGLMKNFEPLAALIDGSLNKKLKSTAAKKASADRPKPAKK